MKTVKDVLKHGKDYPPTREDVMTRLKHVPESVDYNIKHFMDHGDNVATQLKKLHAVDPAKAHSYAQKSLAAIRKASSGMENLIEESCKEC